MKTLASFEPSYILQFVPDQLKKKVKREFIINGEKYLVKINSKKLFVFKKSLICCSCGIVGDRILLQQVKDESPHFNLYSGSILMTQDHIIPLSKGGPDSLDNLQTMCFNCNSKKGNNLAFKYEAHCV